ncbi:hypothetical protein DYB37_005258 [Aphanomyces astaci]|uniref:SAM-dependent MTase RsmB/NOP-type domain-containing protein n=1 Tax=Aphanomyces astaci TaxID=112090 RepID=A0A397B1M5_APHAT|nr:hypothetical protein DYB25_001409 [Aphanomyces astaci]RHZ00534.1 hypothetical protein DYB35_004412 [Aphanomyces astaci]RHZ17784.1 hypothetical protein DYB37_005258 [Aphanomyces astaci]RHZ21944.1 hypothetical protein DYB31_001375 [Aphanomyces astaci]RHZ37864.1 hypothetical protein DYB26_001034 [Aphanomyces astaci]
MNIYNAAASVVDRVRAKHGGIRSALYALPINHALRPTVQALAQESLKHADVLVAAATSCGLLAALNTIDAAERVDAKRFNTLPSFSPENLLVVLAYELLIGPRRKLKGAHTGSIQLVREASPSLTTYLETYHSALIKPVIAKVTAADNAFPRYVRVNTLKTTPEAAKAVFVKAKIPVHIHEFVPELLVLPPGTNLHGHPLIKKGCLFVQDLASCLPVACLAPQASAHDFAIDTCAAPGNKTTQLAAKLALGKPKNRRVQVVAFERAPARAKSLRATVDKASAGDVVSVVETDFLTIDVADPRWSPATLALCDPSCSGSGNVKVGEAPVEHSKEDLQALADHQVAIVRQAMSLPNMRTVVYSTCSTHQVENEDVVDRILTLCKGTWRLGKALPEWPQRGEGPSRMAPKCVRASHAQDTHGFFVCIFEKTVALPVPAETAKQGGNAGQTGPPKSSNDKKRKRQASAAATPNSKKLK